MTALIRYDAARKALAAAHRVDDVKARSGTELNLDGECIGRDVDLCTSLARILKEFIGTRTSGLLFSMPSGTQVLQRSVLKTSLHPILKKLEHEKGGFNIFRRFRITAVQTAECPKPLKHFWSGHAHTHVSERYTKLLQERDFRLEWVEKIGMGFELPALSTGKLGKLLEFLKTG